MIRLIATVAAAAVLWAALAWLGPAATAAPQSAQQSAQLPEAVAPPPLTPATPSHKTHTGAGHSAVPGTVIRGSDTISLVATLPWWRPDETRPPGSDPGEVESPVLTACDLWLGFPFANGEAQSLTVRLADAQSGNEIDLASNKLRVIDPSELNEIDMTAPEEPPSSSRSWLRGLLAVLGGALAAFSAVRYLVA
jgi:hypothetical protein